MPFPPKAAPATTELSRATDSLNPRGPITAVFAPVDLNDDPNLSPSPSADTEELEPRDARPAHPQNSTVVPAQNLTNSRAASKTGELAPNDEGLRSSPGDGRSRKGFFILAAVIALVIGGLAVGVTTHFKQQAQARAAQQQAQMKIENQNQKDGRIGSLRDKIAELNKRLQASDKPSIKKKHDIVESLNRLSQRLDEVSKMSPDQLSEISQACDDIGKELSKIEEEVNSLHGHLPTLETDRDPIKVYSLSIFINSQGDHEDRFDAGNLADVRDHRTDIGVMIRRRFDRNRSLLHLELPGLCLRVLFQQAAYLLLKAGVLASEWPGNCAPHAFNAFDRRVAGAPRDILRFRDRPGAGVPGLFEAAANARSDLLRAAARGVAGSRRGVFDFVTDL